MSPFIATKQKEFGYLWQMFFKMEGKYLIVIIICEWDNLVQYASNPALI